MRAMHAHGASLKTSPLRKRKLPSSYHKNTNNVQCHRVVRKYSDVKHSMSMDELNNLINSIENEANERIEMNIAMQLVQIIKYQIAKIIKQTDGKPMRDAIKRNLYDLYVKLSWCYLRCGRYEEGIAFYNKNLPNRSNAKFYAADNNNKNKEMKEEDDQECNIDTVIDDDDEDGDVNCEENTPSDTNTNTSTKNEKKPSKKSNKKKQKRLQKLKQIESLQPKLRKTKQFFLSPNSSQSTSNTHQQTQISAAMPDIPTEHEVSIRCNVALMLSRIGDYEEALRHTYIMRDLYQQQYEHAQQQQQQEFMKYDPYIHFIQLLVAYAQGHWHQVIEIANKILLHQQLKNNDAVLLSRKNKNKKALKRKYSRLICRLDNHSLFEMYCMLADCYSQTDELEEADELFNDVILPHIVNKADDDDNGDGSDSLDLSLKYHWIYEIYLRHLYHKKDWKRGYTLCMKLFSFDVSYRHNESMTKLCNLFNLFYHRGGGGGGGNESVVFHFVVDAVHFGNQCRFVNHSSDESKINCIFTARCKYGQCSTPSESEVWLKAIKKIDKNTELLVNYGDKYWSNVQCCPALNARTAWDEDFMFTHLCVTEMSSHFQTKQIIEMHHEANALLCDKTFPKTVYVDKDKHGGFALFASMTIKKDAFILRYAGVRKLATNHDESKSRYAIEIINDVGVHMDTKS